MANISNALFEFTDEIVTAAANDSPLSGVQIHANVYEEIKPGKTIRIDDLRQANPVIIPNGSGGWSVRKDNAVVNVQFIAMPVTQKLSAQLEARQLTEDMADAWFIKTFDNQSLQAIFCAIGQVLQFNEWIKPGTVKMPVCVLRLLINPQKAG